MYNDPLLMKHLESFLFISVHVSAFFWTCFTLCHIHVLGYIVSSSTPVCHLVVCGSFYYGRSWYLSPSSEPYPLGI